MFDVRDHSYRASRTMPDVASFSVVPEMVNGKIYILGWTDNGKQMFVWDAQNDKWEIDERFPSL